MSVKVINVCETSLQIGRLIEASGLTVEELRDRLQVTSVQAIYKWMNIKNKTLPSIDNLVLLANVLEVRVEDILVLNELEL